MAAKKYVCKVCGYVHEGNSAPDVCPLCKATADRFDAVAGDASDAGKAAEAPKKKGLNTNSDMYAIIYAAVVVVIVAFLLAGVSSALKSKQDENIRLDKMKQILASLHIKDVKDAKAEFEKVVKKDAVIDSKGTEVKENGGFDVVNDAITPDNLPIYVCEIDGEQKFVIPMTGQGLWGGIWGYMAVNADGNTIYGVYFSHSSETPGLGAEIANDKFTSLFNGKNVMANGAVAIEAVKGRLSNEATQVNAISGATITCNGVNAMLKKCLENYKGFLVAKQGGATNENECTETTCCKKCADCANANCDKKCADCANANCDKKCADCADASCDKKCADCTDAKCENECTEATCENCPKNETK